MATRIKTGPLICWWCGYCLDGVDLLRSDMRCPECGSANLPGNGPESPFVRRPWPRWWMLVLMCCWPGAVLGLLDAARQISHQPAWGAGLATGGTAFVLPALALCLLWSPMIAPLIVDERIHGRVRARVMVALAAGGVAGSLVLASLVRLLAGALRGLG